MIRRYTRFGSLALLALYPSSGESAEAQSATFTFRPPDKTQVRQTVKTTRTRDLGEAGKATDVTETVSRLIYRRTRQGYQLSAHPISATMTRNGQKVNNPLLAVLQDVVTVYQTDPEGRLVLIRGLDQVLEKARKSLPASAVESFASVLNEETLANREAAEWAGRVEALLSRRVRPGDAWAATDPFTLPGGEEIVFYSATKVVGWEKSGNRPCLRLQFSYHTDAQALRPFLGEAFETLQESLQKPEGKTPSPDFEIVGSGHRIIDPATMLIQSEIINRTIKMPVELPGHGMVATVTTETKEYRFEYSLPGKPAPGKPTAKKPARPKPVRKSKKR